MSGIRLGRVIGFEISLDTSWFIILFLVMWSFTEGVFPMQVPGLSRATYLAMGTAGALLFFVSLLAHELSHSVVARRKGIPVEGITLFLFGGVAKTRAEAGSPGDEFWIAFVGPLMSVAIGAALFAAAAAGVRLGVHPAFVAVLQYIGLLNVVLAVFNMLPGFPLDGGRVLRAAVWKATGSLMRATRIASLAGQGVGFLLIAAGVWQALGGNLMGGVWLGFIGWFLRNAAVSGLRQHQLHEVLEEITARQILTPVPETVPPDITLEDLTDRHFMRRRFRAFPVVENDAPLGLISVHQVRDIPRELWARRTARETMTPLGDAIVVRPEDSLTAVLDKVREAPAHRVLVVGNGRLEGIITAGDLASWIGRIRLQHSS